MGLSIICTNTISPCAALLLLFLYVLASVPVQMHGRKSRSRHDREAAGR